MRIPNEQVDIFIVLAHHFFTIFHINVIEMKANEFKECNENKLS
ncbi:hypothetical protein BSI_32750 [Bacillus inaquosorum KCTC 13429]|uniref:Uncharacterized protein n=1 Tax=Bacillus inaquosorum KCTC 13429 TaxID=1236548 RepID=A0A9W5LGK3_9BACI|nr:hypothetical protein BSI_32750 [Bacillus inaquosorum KCTC 13429]